MVGTVGVLATGRLPTSPTRGTLLARRLAATCAGVEAIGALAVREAAHLGMEQAPRVVVLGDGAGWIDTVARASFPGAERRLDDWHLLKRTWDAVRAAKGEAAELGPRLGKLVWRGQVDEALAAIEGERGGPAGAECAR